MQWNIILFVIQVCHVVVSIMRCMVFDISTMLTFCSVYTVIEITLVKSAERLLFQQFSWLISDLISP